jgi:predicted HAD superfamily hydrolase
MRIKFAKGTQRDFINQILRIVGSPSLRELLNRGIGTNYQTLKNYYSGRRLLSEELFTELLNLAKLNKNNFSFELVEENWGKIKGGKASRRS